MINYKEAKRKYSLTKLDLDRYCDLIKRLNKEEKKGNWDKVKRIGYQIDDFLEEREYEMTNLEKYYEDIESITEYDAIRFRNVPEIFDKRDVFERLVAYIGWKGYRFDGGTFTSWGHIFWWLTQKYKENK